MYEQNTSFWKIDFESVIIWIIYDKFINLHITEHK